MRPIAPSRWRSLATKTLDAFLPPLCLGCDRPIGSGHSLCASCWGGIHFIAPPYCAGCGVPFEAPVGDGMLCGGCAAAPPLFDSARAAMLYDDASKQLVLSFKHSDRTHAAQALAGWMRRAGDDLLAQTDLILPVPLHRWRLFKRRYNQAALLAQQIGKLAGKPVQVDTLRRLKPTPTQGHRGRKERQANVKDAFAIAPRHALSLQNKTILLIDDVLTTGATANECASLLRATGAKAVHVLVLARVRGFL